MKKSITRIMAALALLVTLAIPMGMRGQTTVSYGWETSDNATKWTITDAIVATTGEGNTGTYAGKINTNHTYVQFNEKVYVTSFSFAFKRTSNNNNYNVYIETSTDGDTWTAVETYAMGSFSNGSYTTKTHTFDGTTEYYVRFHCYNTTAIRYVDDVTITYNSSAAQLDPCDLTLTNASTSLVFDLYNNSDTQVINYTTSSTGEVTVEDSDYITTEVDQTNKTITVIPVAVTNGAKVITVNQAADDNYAAGSKTFTINITDSTPFTGGDVTFDATVDKDLENTAQGEGSITKFGVTFACNNGILGNGSEYRMYKNSVTTFSVSEGTITQIAFTGTSGNPASGFATQTGWTTDGYNGTWTGSAQEVSFTASGAQVRATLIVVTVEMSTEPSFVITNNEVLAYDATSGSFNYTIINPVQGGYLSADGISLWISDAMAEDGLVTFNTEINPAATSREGIIRMQYTYHGELMTYDVTITQAGAPVIYSSIPALFEAATDTETSVLVTFNNWVVSGVSTNGKNVFVTDNNGNGFVIYGTDMNNDYAVGDILSGTAVSCTLKKYNGFAELINLNAEDLTITSGGTVSTANVAMADLAGVNTGALVHYEGLICSVDNNKYYLTDGTTTLQVYNAIYAFEALEDGETYNITGIYQQYNNTKEILPRSADDIEEVVSTEPSVTVTPNTISAPFAGAEGTLALTYENIEEFISFDYYFCDANGNQLEDTDPDYPGDWIYAEINDENDAYTLSYIIDANDGAARTAYMKVYTFDDNEEVYAIVTVNQAQYVVDYATLPFEFNGGKDAIEETNGLTQSGLGNDYADENTKLKFDSTDDYVVLKINERPGTLTFKIKNNSFSGGTFKVQTSEDGVTYTDLKTYTEITGTQDEEFTNLGENVRYIKWIYTEKVSGNVGLGNIALAEYVAPVLVASITVNPDEVNVDAEEHDGTLDLTYENLTITDMTDFDIQFCDANGDELSEEPDWIEVMVASQNPEIGEGYVVSYYMVENEGTDARTAYFKVYAMDDETNLVYSNLVTISQAAPVVPATPGTWVLTSLADLTADDVFVIVGDNGDTYAMPVDGGGQSGAPAAVAVTVVEGTLSGEPAANLQWNISITEDGYTFYPNGETETWLYCTNTNNGVRVGTNENNVFTMSENGYLYNTATGRYIGIYNSQDWRCYTSEGGNIADQTFAFYKKVLPANSIVIEGYGESEGGYYLIASPFTVSPEDVQGMTEGEYDLYSFDEAEENEWRNYKAGAFTNLEPGKGYLYAHSTTVTLTFDGVAYNGDPIVLQKTAGGDFPGWNLVGNPYTETAYIDRDFYVMNPETGGEIITGKGNEIAAMQGFFVIAANDGEELEISTTAPANQGGKIVMNVSNGRSSVIDRAMVRFGEGRTLPKFMLNDENTKIYITEGNEDFAVVRSIDENATPVSFHAAENGTYTLSINAENVEMEYLHLLDNMTGADVDLLATPSYTFEARTTDYANRFKLVYATTTDVNENNVEPFAFFNGSEWVINNEGEATLQVIDINGRMLSNETVNGNANVNINATSGIYMLRLVNGESVKTQKVVVK